MLMSLLNAGKNIHLKKPAVAKSMAGKQKNMIFYCIRKQESIKTGKVFNYCMKRKCKNYRIFRNKTRLDNYCQKIINMQKSYPN